MVDENAMNDQNLIDIAQQAGVTLPSRYRALLANYPQQLLDMANVFPGPKGSTIRHGPEDSDLYRHLDLLRRANLDDIDYRNSIFPPHFFIIGDSGCGDFYAIDTTNESAPVYMSGPHRGEHSPEPICSSIEDWVALIASPD